MYFHMWRKGRHANSKICQLKYIFRYDNKKYGECHFKIAEASKKNEKGKLSKRQMFDMHVHENCELWH